MFVEDLTLLNLSLKNWSELLLLFKKTYKPS